MKKLLIVFAVVALMLGGCASLTSTTVSTATPQKTLDLLQATHRTVLRAELIYIMQPPCGKSASPPAPLCASYAVGKKMSDLDAKATKALADAQAAIDTVGSNPALVDLAVQGAKLAVTELQNFTTTNTGALP